MKAINMSTVQRKFVAISVHVLRKNVLFIRSMLRYRVLWLEQEHSKDDKKQ